MKAASMIAMILVVVGALNWGLVGLGNLISSNLNLVNLLFGQWPVLESIVYLLVGVSGLLLLSLLVTKKCPVCK
jgi:uncharacterized membrane protein YuzA (DUF378 family)